jgi:HAD superfamily hydrolase (TIGR01509 family)
MGILANESREWMQIKIQKGNLDNIFQKILCSADIGIAKPRQEAFQHMLKEFSVKPRETLFIDNLEQNIDAAASLDIKTRLYLSAGQLRKDLDYLIRT